MSAIDLRDYIRHQDGIWCTAANLTVNSFPKQFTLADTWRPDRLMMRWGGDGVILLGPLRIRVTFQAENLTTKTGGATGYPGYPYAAPAAPAAPPLNGDAPNAINTYPENSGYGYPWAPSNTVQSNMSQTPSPGFQDVTLQVSTIYSYVLEIPAGHQWYFRYRSEEHRVGQGQDPNGYLGRNLYDRIVIEPAGPETVAAPVAVDDLPCNLAVASCPDTSSFFPAACETCEPGAQVRMPPLSPSLSVPTAEGGCKRTRFFNGMSITKEDLEAEQRYQRIKNRLHNRAMGQGVVWGLNVARQGEHICVLPGYGIDCCGNDLTVTSDYKVEIADLLRDPAAAATLATATGEQPQRMHLLLEYVECPTEPRPVHGDPCGPPQQICEPSRVRETVRLRLVPPRDPDISGPMHDFLAAAKSLHERYGEWAGNQEKGAIRSALSEISLAVEANGRVVAKVATGTSATIPGRQVTFAAQISDGELTGGMMRIRTTDGAQIAEMPLARPWFGRETGLTIDLNPETSYLVELVDWRAELPSATATRRAVTGTTTFSLTAGQAEGGVQWDLRGEETGPLKFIDVAGHWDHCDAPLPWPWLHSDPLCEPCAGDPKAAILAVLGIWLQESGGSASGWQGAVAAGLYRAAWLLFYGVDITDEKRDVGEALQKLIRGWCKAALYPGPACAGEPHGVVIGCTTVRGGTIGDIDPFGGRRWVVQYPLLNHWTSQLGLAPLDAVANRLSSLLCSVAALPGPTTPGSTPAFVRKIAVGELNETKWVAYIAFGTEEGLQRELDPAFGPLTISITQTLNLVQFAKLLIETLQGKPSGFLDKFGLPKDTDQVTQATLGGLVEPGVLSLLFARGQ